MRNTRLTRRNRKGAVIVEFALVVPFLFLIVFAVIDFSRAYTQLNAINSALREGARFGSTWDYTKWGDPTTQVKAKVQQYATVFGYNSLDMTKVTVTPGGPTPADPDWMEVKVTAHPLPLPILTGFLGVSPLTVTRSVTFRMERSGRET